MEEQKNNIDVEKLTKLTAEQILTLSNHELIDTIWLGWSTVEHVESALEAFREKGWKHGTLVETANRCNIANLLTVIHKNGKVNIQNVKSEEEYYWRVSFVKRNGNIGVESEDKEICDALWDVILKSNLLI
ncbi:hypothetical protein [Bacillus sp. Brlt_9]|uniref:hypothetical protein n=1 Tax=Bacillus sp. Brlt_9 TaxID=3110916 RepID=UPI003F7BDDFC